MLYSYSVRDKSNQVVESQFLFCLEINVKFVQFFHFKSVAVIKRTNCVSETKFMKVFSHHAVLFCRLRKVRISPKSNFYDDILRGKKIRTISVF